MPIFWANAGAHSAAARQRERIFFMVVVPGGWVGIRGAASLRRLRRRGPDRGRDFLLAPPQEQLARDEQVEAVTDVHLARAVHGDRLRDAARSQVRTMLRARLREQVEPRKLAAEPAIERQREPGLRQ